MACPRRCGSRATAGDGDPVLIAPDLPQPPAVLRIAGGGGAWQVAFDGFGAAVARVGELT